MMKKILFLCAETYPVQYTFLEKVFNEIFLESYGHKVYWIMVSNINKPHKIRWGANNVILIPKVKSNSLFGLIIGYINHILFISRASKQILKETKHVDLIQVRDDPFMAFRAYILARRFNIPFVYQISHLKEEELMLSVKMKLRKRGVNYIRGLFGFHLRNWLLKKADIVLAISEQMKETLVSYGIVKKKIYSLPEGIEPFNISTTNSVNIKAVQEKFKLNGKRVLIYVGTLNKFRRLDFLFRVLKLASKTIPNIHLLIVGKAQIKEDELWLEEKSKFYNVGNIVTFTGWVSREEIPSYILAAEIGLSPFPPDKILINNSPIKILEYLNFGIPVVASNIPEQKKIIEESGGGYCVAHKEEDFAKSILNLMANHEIAKKMGKNGQCYVQVKRNYAILAKKLDGIYKDILKE